MCGRFTLFLDPADLQDAFPEFTFPPQGTRRYNIAPTQPVLVLPNDGTGRADFFTWGLIPSWAKDPAIGSRMINRAWRDPRREALLPLRLPLPPLPGLHERFF